ncbi:MAG: hypothetical protein RLZZ431_1472 [Bacteroidota bacterium]
MRLFMSILFIGFFLFTKAQPAFNDKNVFEFRDPIKHRKKNLLHY